MVNPRLLKWPFDRENMRICVVDRVWYVPKLANRALFAFPGWSHPDFFENSCPVHVEFCSGNGQWIANKASQFPHINWLAVERRWDRASKIWAKIKNLNLNNLIVVWGDAVIVSSFLPNQCVDAIYVNFPDPWPKRRHAKNRLIAPEFIKEMQRILKPKGLATLVTDDADYSRWMIKHMLACKDFSSEIKSPYYQAPPLDYGTSYFESLFREQGKNIHYHVFSAHEKIAVHQEVTCLHELEV